MKKRPQKKDEKEAQFKKFKEMLRKIQVNIPFYEAIDQMQVYVKFMKELPFGRRRLRDDENVVLTEECSHIIQRKLSPKLIDPDRFIIPCFIGPIKVGQALCDLRSSIHLMSLSMMWRLGCGEPKSTHMTLTLVD